MRAIFFHLTGPSQGQTQVFEKSPVTVGRKEGNDISFGKAHKNVSSLHALITEERGAYWVADADSTNGTKVNGIKIFQKTQIHDGDVIQFGKSDAQVRFHYPSDAIGAGKIPSHQARVGPKTIRRILGDAAVAAAMPVPVAPPSAMAASAAPAPRSSNTRRPSLGMQTMRFVKEVLRQTATESRVGVRVSIVVLLLAVVGTGGWFGYQEFQRILTEKEQAEVREQNNRATRVSVDFDAAVKQRVAALAEFERTRREDDERRAAWERDVTRMAEETGGSDEEQAERERQVAAMRTAQEIDGRFQEWAQRHARSVVLLYYTAEFAELDGRQSRSVREFGTGFRVGDRWIFTAREVAQPAIFPGRGEAIASGEYAEATKPPRMIVAWQPGALMKSSNGLSLESAVYLYGAQTAQRRMAASSIQLPLSGEEVEPFGSATGLYVLEIEEPAGAPAAPALARGAPTAAVGDAIAVVGYTADFFSQDVKSGALEIVRGEITDASGPVLALSIPAVPPLAGAPVLDAKGRVIGVAARSADGKSMVCIPAEPLLELLGKNPAGE